MCTMPPSAISRINKEKQVATSFGDNHPNCVYKPIEFFERKLKSIQKQKTAMTTFATENKVAVYVSYSYVALYQIEKQKKARTIDKEFFMPVIKEVVKIMIGQKESKKLDFVFLSIITVKKRIVDMSNDILEQMLNEVKNSPPYLI